jgi:hypothetical protein
MTTTAIKHVNTKLKSLPDALLEEVEKYIDFLAYKYSQEIQEIPEWHKEEILKRVKENKTPIDAFEMLNNLDID